MSLTPRIHDLHVHTGFSPDSTTQMEAYAQEGHQHLCHIGFLDHFEYAFMNRPNHLNEDNMAILLEEFDRVHASYPNTSLGLEVDFFVDLQSEIAEFCDNHRKDFDYLIGALHVIGRLAVTYQKEMKLLVKNFGLLGVLKRYFEGMEILIKSKLFDGVAHLDVAMRYANAYPITPKVKQLWQSKTQELGFLCKTTGLPVEVNVGGLFQPWGLTYPSLNVIDKLLDAGTRFFIGSDSHSIESFQRALPKVQEMTEYLRQRDGLCLPSSLESSPGAM
ncbi:MAG: histidinol-phosphatase HisJ family protein [Promethearchaeota archaeon]